MATALAAVPKVDIQAVQRLTAAMAQVVRGKPEAVRAAIVAVLARGHLLIEDVPGVGKTTLARSLAAALGGTFRRIQFTSDLLPADIVGVSIFDQSGRAFEFRPGPLFANVVLADEINRTTPRTQSALLEAMSEGRVTVDNTTHTLATPFVVLATQNPTEQYGTYPLPESQLDRFVMRISLGYPARAVEREVLRAHGSVDPVAALAPVVTLDEVRALQAAVEHVTVADGLIDYAMGIVEQSRQHAAFAVGVSTRGALAWYRVAQASALCAERTFCIPDDFKHSAVAVLAHRCVLRTPADSPGKERAMTEAVFADLIQRTPIPT